MRASVSSTRGPSLLLVDLWRLAVWPCSSLRKRPEDEKRQKRPSPAETSLRRPGPKGLTVTDADEASKDYVGEQDGVRPSMESSGSVRLDPTGWHLHHRRPFLRMTKWSRNSSSALMGCSDGAEGVVWQWGNMGTSRINWSYV